MGKLETTYVTYIGTSKIVFLKSITSGSGKIRIDGVSVSKAVGFEKGIVKDLKSASGCLSKLSRQILGTDFRGIIPCRVVASNARIKEYIFQSSIYFHGNPHPVNMKDVRDVIAQTRSVATIPLTDVVVQAVVQQFLVNDIDGVQNPLGLEATRLGVMLRLLTLNYLEHTNFIKVFERSEIEVTEVIPNALAAANAVLTDEQRQAGVILVSVGSYATHLACYKNAILLKVESIPIGSDMITEGIEQKMSLDREDAQRLKEVFASASRKTEFQDELIPLPTGPVKGKTHLRRADFETHLETGLNNFFKPVEDEIRRLKEVYSPLNQVIFVGGGVKLDGFLERIQDGIGSQASIGYVTAYDVRQDILDDPAFFAVLGGINFDSRIRDEDIASKGRLGWLGRSCEGVRDWMNEYF
jgi:cell division protein FtsA